MVKKEDRKKIRVKKHYRMRRHIVGSQDRPRLCVFRSNLHIYAQIIDDTKGCTLVAASTVEPDVKSQVEKTSNVEAATVVGTVLAKRAVEKGNEKVIFDRGGFLYHGKVKALAEAAREAGLQF